MRFINDSLKFSSMLLMSVFISMVLFVLLSILGSVTPETLEMAIFSSEVQFAIQFSLMTASIATTLGLIIGVPAAYALARYDFRGKNLIDAMVEVPVVIPPLISGFALLVFFGNTIFGQAISEQLKGILFTPKGVIVAQFFVATPFIVRTSKSVFEKIDSKYEYIAQSLGAGKVESFFKISLPMAKNGILAGMFLAWARSIGEFGATMMVAGATKMKTETLPVAVFLNISLGNIDMALTIAFVFLMVALIILLTIRTIANYGSKY
ncbi:molybdate transport system permease protein [Methanococcus voltae]|uniref:Molybdate transport system permease protein n=2 Tax=Methanococcus voltae TaxID=2188 RepID=A0A8J7RGV2_METVO|nr:ABC transporter permease [Methanococcus voltae]MBP2144273.1 molybdate transport system permease protein [Methanococcus voltae]MBP2171812.1 molybdate transport system permease protein [Methanococcus voltae]MBP2201250.1 molybdate transport system permease protein [Methanococcus voltae]MCS3922808.1 molybdate transport system permease protein [Methanococcus voltae PS]